jgi:hypothetical protein
MVMVMVDDGFHYDETTVFPNEQKIDAIAKKLRDLMAAIGYIQKDAQNSFHKYKYLSHAGLLEKVQPNLVKLGLAATVNNRVEDIRTKKVSKVGPGGVVTETESVHVVVRVTVTLIDAESGQYLKASACGSGEDNQDKAVMKAQTAAHKYAWLELLNIPTGDDPEATS